MQKTSTIYQEKTGFGERLKLLRIQKGFSQKDIASKLDLHFTTYGSYERGDAMPPADNLRILAGIFEVSIDYLLEGEEEDAITVDLEDQNLLSLFKEVDKLQNERKNFIKNVIEALLKSEKHQQVADSRIAS